MEQQNESVNQPGLKIDGISKTDVIGLKSNLIGLAIAVLFGAIKGG